MDTFGFTLVASGIGMAIVFVFLTSLSLIMSGIRGVDRAAGGARTEPSAGRSSAVRQSTGVREGAAAGAFVSGHPAWVIAAVTAYLDAERENSEHSAAIWTRRQARG